MSDLKLFGFGPSVYTRVVRIVLAEKSLRYDYVEVNPFDETEEKNPHPFGRVPTLRDGDFEVYETAAITRYLDAAYPSPVMTPAKPKAAARMAQVVGIVDAYAYWPLVRQVFGQAVFRPAAGLDWDTQDVEQGLQAASPVLDALEQAADEGLVLGDGPATLAECHLAPVMAAFTAASEGAAALRERHALTRWWRVWSQRASVRATDTGYGVRPAAAQEASL